MRGITVKRIHNQPLVDERMIPVRETMTQREVLTVSGGIY